MTSVGFEWDAEKDRENKEKHGVSFKLAQYAFADPDRVIAQDLTHSGEEARFLCFGRVGGGILTVRFTYRGGTIRIFGAGYWRKGRKTYEQERHIH
jgi:uncharacterized DUF497 family protein